MRKFFCHNFYISLLLTSVLFFVFLFFLKPLINDDVDIYFLYTLSGGYGSSPSALLHYSYGLHPILGSIIEGLFEYSQAFNWYSLFLITFHFVCCVALLMSFLNSFSRRKTIIGFIIFFLFVESRLLLGCNYSGAALIGAISASISLVLFFKNNDTTRRYGVSFYFFLLLLLIAGLIRIHYVVLFGSFAIWMGFFFLSRPGFIRYFLIQILLWIFLVVLFQGQSYFYEKKIPGWATEEKKRQAFFYIYNHSRKRPPVTDAPSEKLKSQLIEAGFFYDTSLVTYKSIVDYGRNNVRKFNNPWNKGLYWLFMDFRVYLFLFAAVILLLLMNRNFKMLLRFFCVSFFPLLVFISIAIFFKISGPFFLYVMASILLAAFVSVVEMINFKRISLIVFSLLLLLSSAWMIVRLLKIGDKNIREINHARALVNELNTHRNILFVSLGEFFNLHLSIWDTPQQYPVNNLIYYDLFFSNSYDEQLRRYGVRNLAAEIPLKDNICVTGGKVTALVEYYGLWHNQPVDLEKIPGFQYMDVFRVRLIDHSRN